LYYHARATISPRSPFCAVYHLQFAFGVFSFTRWLRAGPWTDPTRPPPGFPTQHSDVGSSDDLSRQFAAASAKENSRGYVLVFVLAVSGGVLLLLDGFDLGVAILFAHTRSE